MPATRKSARHSGGHGKQSTLSFNHRVTKAVPKSIKDGKPSALSKEYIPEPEPEKTHTEDVVVAPTPTPTVAEPEVEKSEAELKAEKISNAAVERYWGKIEESRKAKAVHKKHTQDLTTGEKVLRYFDVSSQYGPCIGITRLKRWQRAEMLGLKPPIEVLTVLLKEEAQDNKGIERAHIDDLLNSATADA